MQIIGQNGKIQTRLYFEQFFFYLIKFPKIKFFKFL
jgi:hypothetical protein